MKININLIKELREKTSFSIIDCKKALIENDWDIINAELWLNKKTNLNKKDNDKNIKKIYSEGTINIFNNSENNKIVIFELNCETDFVSKNVKFINLINYIGDILLNNNEINNSIEIEKVLEMKLDNLTINEYISNFSLLFKEKISLRRFWKFEKLNNQYFSYYLHSNKKIGSIVIFDINKKNEDQKNNYILEKNIAMHIVAMNPKLISRDFIKDDFLNLEKIKIEHEIKNDKNNNLKSDFVINKIISGRLEKKISEICLLEQMFIFDLNSKVKKILNNTNINIINFIRYEIGEKL